MTIRGIASTTLQAIIALPALIFAGITLLVILAMVYLSEDPQTEAQRSYDKTLW
jgi:hypothetical protein